MIRASSSGTAKVSPPYSIFPEAGNGALTRWIEYLRGIETSESNECTGIFKEYQKCLTVWTKNTKDVNSEQQLTNSLSRSPLSGEVSTSS
jgi:hypothetical protein